MKMLLATTAILSMAALGTVANAQTAPKAAPTAVAVPNNILLADWTGPYAGVPSFDKVTPALFPQALQFAIDERRNEILAIANNPDAPTFANTIEAYEKSGQRLDRVEAVFGVMTSNMATPEYQKLDKEWSSKLSAASDEITLNPKLFKRIKTLYDNKASLGLDAKQDRVLTRTYQGFVRRGANLSPEQKQQLSAMNSQLAELFATFSERVLADESTYLTVTEAELIDHVRGHIAHYKAPREVEFLDALPKTSTGKTQKYALREKEWAGETSRIRG